LAKGSILAVGMDKKAQEHLKKSGTIPAHIAIIMDGNGRWAKKKKLPRVAGHNEGVNAVRDIVETCAQVRISISKRFGPQVRLHGQGAGEDWT